jgi:hypothetical protein
LAFLDGKAAMVRWGEIELPGFDAPLVSVALERRDGLGRLVRELIADLNTPASAVKQPEPLAPEDARRVASACALCRGFCCSKAGDAAYLNPATMSRVWRAEAHLTEDQLVSAYVEAVPDRAFEGSCIFHASDGCNLPPSMRSNVCLTYQCTPLRDALAAAASDESLIRRG